MLDKFNADDNLSKNLISSFLQLYSSESKILIFYLEKKVILARYLEMQVKSIPYANLKRNQKQNICLKNLRDLY